MKQTNPLSMAMSFLLGGPDNLLSGWPRATGSGRIKMSVPLASCALRAPGQQVARATRRVAPRVLLCLLLAVSLAQAQTNGPGQMQSPQDKLNDIRPPFFFLHSWPWFWIALAAAAAIIALLVALWFWLRPHRLLSAKSAYELALEKLEKARALLREDEPMPYAVLVSETIRSYLGQRFETPSTRRTTEEFLRQMEGDRATPLAEHRDLLKDFLQSCDLVKFARYQPTLTELEQVHQRATTFVTATKPAPASGRNNGSHP